MKSFKLNRAQILSVIFFILLTLLYSQSVGQDPYHGEIYWSFERVFKYFFISYSSLLPLFSSPNEKFFLGLLLFLLNFWVWRRGSHYQRLILIAGVSLNIMIALGRASVEDRAFINPIQSRYYTLWAPIYFVNVDFFFSQFKGLVQKAICLGLFIFTLYGIIVGVRGGQAFQERRLVGIACLKSFYETGNVKEDCNTNYLFLAGFDQPPHKDFGRTKGDLIYTSNILKNLASWENHER